MSTRKKIYIVIGIIIGIIAIAAAWYYIAGAKWRKLKAAIIAKKQAFGPYKELSGQDEWNSFSSDVKLRVLGVPMEQWATITPEVIENTHAVVLGFFKSYDIQPSGWNVKLLESEIKQYIANGGKWDIYVTKGERL
jgi:hypothetical protein